jgi:hypothetical protein
MAVHARDSEISNIYYSWNVSRQLRKIKQKAIEYKGGKCIICGYNKCSTSMVFHHRNPEEKEFNIGHKLAKWEVIRAELDKCDLLCLNCHGEVHELDYKKTFIEKETFIRSQIPERKFGKLKTFYCKHCKSEFTGYKNRQYCSYKCKGNSLRKIPNSQQELQSLVNKTPIKILAINLGVTIRAIQLASKKLGVIIPNQKLTIQRDIS